jgi:Putative Ig domain
LSFRAFSLDRATQPFSGCTKGWARMNKECWISGVRQVARSVTFTAVLAAGTLNVNAALASAASSGATSVPSMSAKTSQLVNSAPTLSGTPGTTASVGQSYSFTPTVSNPSGKSLSFSIANQPSWASFNTVTGRLYGTPTQGDAGTVAHVVVIVRGATGASSLPMFTLTVQGGNSTSTYTSSTMSPSTLRLVPGSTWQMTVNETYSNGQNRAMPSAEEIYQSSNLKVATVSTTGVVTVALNAAAGSTASINAIPATGRPLTSATPAQLVVIAAGTPPTANSVVAARATAQNNPLCGAPITPFYWEIGDQNGALVSGSHGSGSDGPVLATTKLSVASASKLIYATYVTQLRGAAANLSAQDIDFLHFTSGYTNMGTNTTSGACPNTLNPDTVNQCLTLTNAEGVSFAAQDPTTIGKFDYDGGHMENHAKLLQSLGNVVYTSLGSTVGALLGADIDYTEPLVSGGISAAANDYALVLRHILDGSLYMRGALGTNAVCTHHSSTCTAVFSPIPEAWHYSLGHWVEDDPNTKGDGAFSSPGAFGFYPWIDSSKKYYGVISRSNSTGTGEQEGYESMQCGRLIRHAWMTGVEQMQPLPTG